MLLAGTLGRGNAVKPEANNVNRLIQDALATLAEFGKPGASFAMKRRSFEGDCAYILWTAETADNRYELATDTFIVRDGKIVVQSFAGRIVPKSRSL